MLQYRVAAVAGFATQCWWGTIKVMVYSAFYGASPLSAAAPMALAQVITYSWLGQAFLALTPWSCDPEVALAVKSGAVAHDRLRPVDTYALWYVRAAGWMTARALPRATLMLMLAGVALPALGLAQWSWTPPPNAEQAALFAFSLILVVMLSSAITMLLNISVVTTLNDRGVNSVIAPFTIILTGSLIPLPLFPNWLHTALFIQPLAGVFDIPFRIYTGNLAGTRAVAGIGLQIMWTIVIVIGGRWWMHRVMRRLQVQGG